MMSNQVNLPSQSKYYTAALFQIIKISKDSVTLSLLGRTDTSMTMRCRFKTTEEHKAPGLVFVFSRVYKLVLVLKSKQTKKISKTTQKKSRTIQFRCLR